MAYEVVFKFYDVNEDGSFNKSEPKELKKKYGSIDEDFPLEKLMSNITGYLARRDIFVHDVEVYEFTKKKITFKITKDGLVLKQQKVSYDEMLQTTNIENSIVDKNQPIDISPVQDKPKTQQVQSRKSKFVDLSNRVEINRNKKPVRSVVFSPPLNVDKSKFNYKFTRNKQYPVYAERYADNGIGMVISTFDDANNHVDVHDEYFIPAGANFEFIDELNTKKDGNIDLLNWKGDTQEVPVLRK